MTRAESPSRDLADFLSGLSGRVGERLLNRAVDALLDTLGCMAFGSSLPWSQAALAYAAKSGGEGPATVIGSGACRLPGIDREGSRATASATAAPVRSGRDGPARLEGSRGAGSATLISGGSTTTPAMAAFANGASAHAFELDDVHEEAISHPGAVVVPAALSLAEDLGTSNLDLLEAVVVGYEAMGRAGIAVGPATHMLAGFHPTSMSGVFGSTAAAARLLGFDGEALNHAFGVAVSLACGTMEFAASGGMAKRIHAGRAAEAGLLAASLAADGLEGATDGLAGRYGFCNVFGTAPRISSLTEALGERWMIDEITVKPYAACSDVHPLIQATAELRAEHRLKPEQIDRIEADVPTKAATQNNLDGTASVMAAQYSAQFNIAAAILADPGDPATYSPERIAAPELADLQTKVVSLRAAKQFDDTYAQRMGGRVRIFLNNGEVLERTVHGQKGSMHDPLTRDELDAKFASLVADSAPPDLAGRIRSHLADPSGPAGGICELPTSDG